MSTHNLFPAIQTFISMIFKNVTQFLLGFTLYHTMRVSHDFTDVKSALDERTDWSIELCRSCLTIHFINGNSFFVLTTLTFLIMAEGIHIHYSRLSPEMLQKRVEDMRYAAFALVLAVLDVGAVVVRVSGLVVLSGNPGLATCLILVGMLPSTIFPLLAFIVELVKQRRRVSGGERFDAESGIVVDGIQS